MSFAIILFELLVHADGVSAAAQDRRCSTLIGLRRVLANMEQTNERQCIGVTARA